MRILVTFVGWHGHLTPLLPRALAEERRDLPGPGAAVTAFEGAARPGS